MFSISITIEQDGDEGGVNISRDDLELNKKITLKNNDNSGVNYFKWEFLSWPSFSFNSAPVLSGLDSSEASFTPIESGTYIIRLTLNKNITGTIGAAIKSVKLDLRYSSCGESNEFNGWNKNLTDNFITIEEHGIFNNIDDQFTNISRKR